MTSQANYETLRKETMMTIFVKNIARDTKKGMVKNYPIVNSKETNTKSWVMVGLW